MAISVTVAFTSSLKRHVSVRSAGYRKLYRGHTAGLLFWKGLKPLACGCAPREVAIELKLYVDINFLGKSKHLFGMGWVAVLDVKWDAYRLRNNLHLNKSLLV